MLDVVRAPLLGSAPAPTTWFFLLGMLAFGLVLSSVVAANFGRKIVFWV
jgi:ABC-type polysaccharide/polyol phosphate export permease